MDGQKGRPISKPTGPRSAAAPSRAHITDHLMEGGRRALLSVKRRRRRGRPPARARDRFGSEQQVHRSSVCPERVPATDCASERASERPLEQSLKSGWAEEGETGGSDSGNFGQRSMHAHEEECEGASRKRRSGRGVNESRFPTPTMTKK